MITVVYTERDIIRNVRATQTIRECYGLTLRVDKVSSNAAEVTLQMMAVLEFPPREF